MFIDVCSQSEAKRVNVPSTLPITVQWVTSFNNLFLIQVHKRLTISHSGFSYYFLLIIGVHSNLFVFAFSDNPTFFVISCQANCCY